MIKKLIFLAGIILFCTAGFAQNITIYQDAYFKGASKTVYGNTAFVGNDWNDRISSIRVPNGYRLIVYRDANYKGATTTITGDWTVTPTSREWNDQISSFKIERIERMEREERREEPGVTVYWDADYKGNSKVFTADAAWVGNDWNDQISSIRVPRGYKVIVYRDSNFRGASLTLNSDWTVTAASREWNDQISSLKIIKLSRGRY